MNELVLFKVKVDFLIDVKIIEAMYEDRDTNYFDAYNYSRTKL